MSFRGREVTGILGVEREGGLMIRGSFAVLLVWPLVFSAGCGSKPEQAPVYQIKTNDYELEFDGQQKKATFGDGHFLIVRDYSEDIRVAEGRLSVGKTNYGAVRIKDRISVVGGKVSVNGLERKPSGS